MNIKTLIAIVALIPVAPLPAVAGEWLKNCRSGQTVTGLSPGDSACYQPASNSDDSVTLNLRACENSDVRYFLDRNGDTTASTVTPTLRCCPMGTTYEGGKAGDSDACWVIENVTMDGDPSTGNEAIYGFKCNTVFADMPASGTIADPQFDVDCNGPKN